VLDTLEDIGGDGELRALSQLSTVNLGGNVCILDPKLVVDSSVCIDMVLEDHDIVVGHSLGVH
jgi:hypothetical protein